MLSLENATIGYGRNVVLYEKTSLCLEQGQIMGFVAPNGYGKTTLMRILGGDTTCLKTGSVSLDRVQHVRDFSSADVLYVPGDASMLYGGLSVREHVRMAKSLWPTDISPDDVMRDWGLEHFIHKPIRSLSQGMKQQVTLAVAEMSSARYLLLDEPMNALDPINVSRAANRFKKMAEQGRGILISSHILSNIDDLCEKVLFIDNKKIVEVACAGGVEEQFEAYYMRG